MTANQIAKRLLDAGFTMTLHNSNHRRFTKNGVVMTLPSASHESSAPWVVSAMKSSIRRAEENDPNRKLSQDLPGTRKLTVGEVKPGKKVKARRPFVDVPKGTVGQVEEDYGPGFFILWANGIRDAFDKSRELVWLEAVA